jgi:hypothetical protein
MRGKPVKAKGFVLLISLILLLSISVITAAFVYLVTIRTRAVASGLDNSKAFWLAEAGIQQVIYTVKTDANYRDAPTTITGNLGDGKYSVTVVKQTGKTVYDMVSTGTVGGASRSIGQTATLVMQGWTKPFTDYGVFAGGGSINLQSTSKILGDVYTVGTVTTASKASVTGTVYANSGSGNYTRLPLPNPTIPAPALTKTYYTTLINTAKTVVAGNKTYDTLALAGGTVYINGTVSATNITGPGTVVSTGVFTIGGGNVGQGVNIISNSTISASSSSHIQSLSVLYATTGISLAGSGVVIDNAALITPGTVSDMAKSVTIHGAIFCGGNLSLTGKTTMTGAVVSGGTITMSSSAQIIRSSSELPLTVPNGVENISSVTLSAWQEV